MVRVRDRRENGLGGGEGEWKAEDGKRDPEWIPQDITCRVTSGS